MAHSLQGVYSPLPQSLSDSDSEKEISMEPVCPNYGNGLKNTKKIDNSRQNGHLNFNNINDEIIKIKRVNPKMSTLRKTALIFSILLCFLPIVIFLWILPCSDSNTCPIKISNWEYQQDNIELKGKINLVHGIFKNNLNLALMYKGSFNTPKSLKNGVLSFVGSKGAVAWDFQQDSYPIELNCSIIDIDGNGYSDCLLTDERGLKAIETITGEAIWHAHSAEEKSIPHLDMPVKVGDFNNDDTSELMSVYQKSSFLLISGKTGLALKNIKVSGCATITNLTIANEKIRFACQNAHENKIYESLLADLKRNFEYSQGDLLPKEVEKNSINFYQTGYRKLAIENYGDCPSCQCNISFYSSNNTKLKTWTYQYSYVMNPVPFSFQSSVNNVISLKGHVNGFILKIWEWKNFSKKLPHTSRVYRRSIPVYNSTYYVNEITERVVLITFNETNTHIINASLIDVNQICNGPEHQTTCQPDQSNQQNSLLIADLDYDNSQELISYSSSYQKRDEDGKENWRLVSYLKVFRLESELPKLYGSN